MTSPTEPSKSVPAVQDLFEINAQRRLTQILTVAIVATLLLAITEQMAGNQLKTVVLLTTLCPLALSMYFASKRRVALSVNLLIGTIVTGLAIVMAMNQGLRDGAVITLACPLIFAAMIGSRKVFFVTLFSIMLMMTLIALADITGWYIHIVQPVGIGTLVAMLIILLVTAFCVWVMSNDLRDALVRAASENKRVLESQAHIESLALRDMLTGLPNLMAVSNQFEKAASHATRYQKSIAMLYLDIDNFKAVNDSLGHAAGDKLLVHLSKILRQSVRAADSVSRLGGDEYLILIGDLNGDEGIATVVNNIMKQISEPFAIEGMDVSSTCSMGIALFPGDGGDFNTLLKKADTAMYHAKDSGRNTFHLFNEKMNANIVEHLHLISGMRIALEKNEFTLHYQPQFDLKTGRIIGAEALIRWRHPEIGLIPPIKFIPAAERSGMIVQIGTWVLKEACRQVKEWELAGMPGIVVAINLSSVQLKRDDIERVIMNALDSVDLSPNRIELELTESLLIADSAKFAELLKRLSSLGLSFAIDDFGTGYSNLGYLKRFAVNRLKIDRSFIQNVANDSHNEAIVTAIIQIAKSLKMEVVAEGVEDEASLKKIIELGCDHGQGWLWSPALPAAEFFSYASKNQPLFAE